MFVKVWCSRKARFAELAREGRRFRVGAGLVCVESVDGDEFAGAVCCVACKDEDVWANPVGATPATAPYRGLI